MNVIIKSLTIINFKGIAKLTIPFGAVTNVYGANASGKTTIFDAFTFLLFGKDSGDRKDFEIKPLDGKGNPKKRTENEVSAVLDIEGEEVHLRHVMKEKWVKKRGEESPEFTGNEHLYFWNEVPLQAGEYQAKVNAILPESVFKLLTNPLYFNSMKWQDRRTVLQEIAGEVTDSDLIGLNPDFAKLIEQLAGKTLKEFRAQNAAQKKKLKDELATIPARIDELERGKPELENEDEVNAEIEGLQAAYNYIEQQIEDRNEAQNALNEQISELNQRKHELITSNQQIVARHTQDYNTESLASGSTGKELYNEIARKKDLVSTVSASVNRMQEQLAGVRAAYDAQTARVTRIKTEMDSRITDLRKKFEAVNARELDESETVCSECGRPHEAHNIDDIREKFNQNKIAQLQDIKTQGDTLKKEIADIDEALAKSATEVEEETTAIEHKIAELNEQITNEQATIAALQRRLDDFNANKVVVKTVADRLNDDAAYNKNLELIASINAQLEDVKPVDISDLRTKKAVINADLDAAKRKLQVKDQIAATDQRISELKEQEKTMAQELAAIERQEFVAENYEKAKSEELERRVNGMFKHANFKMFNQLINGGEEPTCVTTYKGVPFPDLNNAAKILVGIDIINTLSAHHGVTAPVFLDNRESVSSIPDTAAQVINLIVSPEDKELRVA